MVPFSRSFTMAMADSRLVSTASTITTTPGTMNHRLRSAGLYRTRTRGSGRPMAGGAGPAATASAEIRARIDAA